MTRFVENSPSGEGLALACKRASVEDASLESVLTLVPHYPLTEQEEYLRAWRNTHRLSMRDLADLLGWSVVQVGDLHRGKVSVHPDDWPEVLHRLALWEAL